MKSMTMVVLMGLLVGVTAVSAREIGSGGGTVTSTACNPVKSVTAKGDARVGETGTSSVQFGWSVSPCEKGQSVVVVATVMDSASKQVYFADLDAGLNGKLVLVVPFRRGYACTVAVYDAATGQLLGTQSAYASTTPKGGV